VQPQGDHGGAVVGGAAGVTLLGEGQLAEQGAGGDERQKGLVAHGEAQHGHRGGEESRAEPGLAELDRGEEGGEPLTEPVVEGELHAERQEREQARPERRHGPHGGGAGRDIEGAAVGPLLGAEREAGEHQRPERDGGGEVHQQLRRGEPEAHERPGIRADAGSIGAAAEDQCGEEGHESHQDQGRRSGEPGDSQHHISLFGAVGASAGGDPVTEPVACPEPVEGK
jgi:hypothetical protein